MMVHGSKRFRVSGAAVGSAPTIDHQLAPGDALFIPALAFHTGGDSTTAEPTDEQAASRLAASSADSFLLSVAMRPAEPAQAAEAVRQWRAARRLAIERLPAGRGTDWGWAGSDQGRATLHKTLGGNPEWRRFLI